MDLPYSAPERGYPLAYQNGEEDLYRFEWDGLGQLSARQAPSTGGASDARIEYGYDVHGLTSSVTPPERDAHAFSFDGHDALTNYAPPELASGATPTNWVPTQERGETDRAVMADGNQVELTYDPVTGQLTRATFDSLQPAPGTGGEMQLSYVAGTGQLESATMPQHPLFVTGGEPSSGPISTSLTYDGPLLLSQTTTGFPG